MENWKKIQGFEDYSVSDMGRVRRDKDFGNTFAGRILKPLKDGNGYHHVRLMQNNVGKKIRIHRLVAIAFIPNLENKKNVNHIDGNKTNNLLPNLEWASDSENFVHALNNGLVKLPKGEKHKASKLKICDVIQIKDLLKKQVLTQDLIAQKFRVSQNAISQIKLGKNWAHI